MNNKIEAHLFKKKEEQKMLNNNQIHLEEQEFKNNLNNTTIQNKSK